MHGAGHVAAAAEQKMQPRTLRSAPAHSSASSSELSASQQGPGGVQGPLPGSVKRCLCMCCWEGCRSAGSAPDSLSSTYSTRGEQHVLSNRHTPVRILVLARLDCKRLQKRPPVCHVAKPMDDIYFTHQKKIMRHQKDQNVQRHKQQAQKFESNRTMFLTWTVSCKLARGTYCTLTRSLSDGVCCLVVCLMCDPAFDPAITAAAGLAPCRALDCLQPRNICLQMRIIWLTVLGWPSNKPRHRGGAVSTVAVPQGWTSLLSSLSARGRFLRAR
jgi:hypothetical protein